jgi:hypothetical protein
MPNTMHKSTLPIKICIVCNKPFSWRKKWAGIWLEVKYCSERCRKNKKTKNEPTHFKKHSKITYQFR